MSSFRRKDKKKGGGPKSAAEGCRRQFPAQNGDQPENKVKQKLCFVNRRLWKISVVFLERVI
jgi:hypothetical protein